MHAKDLQQYVATDTQAVGRARRYGQLKEVHCWRFDVRGTIDSALYRKWTGRDFEAEGDQQREAESSKQAAQIEEAIMVDDEEERTAPSSHATTPAAATTEGEESQDEEINEASRATSPEMIDVNCAIHDLNVQTDSEQGIDIDEDI